MNIDYSGLLYKIGVDVSKELQAAIEAHSLFTSPHHGYAIILEELDELWDEVKKRQPDVKNMRSEAVQVAAMAMKFILSIENDWKPVSEIEDEQKELQAVAKCQQCLYHSMTKEELAKLEEDPCDTCYDHGNWKPKEDVPE
ncbi:hypothetical protein E4K67_22520 [Desulfosporosinus fructosivorans]|uniref:Uncharacterized protein n=1 Tax=Desulfosporosinus fructosivorans TaxID=2018669 RepID=A0A4Z0QZL2_9FIRM|nr:hypothetical protein [Desulfosporosinus fructosivorans]TGE35894.1 hypothetical protein E4K67_22520 [Desulfosporosinus fructosivorans]